MKTIESLGITSPLKPQHMLKEMLKPRGYMFLHVDRPETDNPFDAIYDRGKLTVTFTEGNRHPKKNNHKPTVRGVNSTVIASIIAAINADEESKPVDNIDPTKELKDKLAGDWFAEVCFDPNYYNRNWTDNFIDNLMQSKYGKNIENNLKIEKRRRIYIGMIVGALAEAGILKGSKLSIAEAYIKPDTKFYNKEENEKKVSTFANYMGRCKKEEFLGWVKYYVKIEKSV